ncbi:MAG: gliding motility-associated C-terminal domain-containing protein [Elusimicrobia bacterium]|nr:gliding motility-associated C-terminal domain-containing protein [Elusimicrobiota bacterium]
MCKNVFILIGLMFLSVSYVYCADMIIYEDTLSSSWENQSMGSGSAYNFDSSSPVYSGSKAISCAMSGNNWPKFVLTCTSFSVTNYKYLTFMINGGTAGNQNLLIIIEKKEENETKTSLCELNKYIDGAIIVKDEWKKVTVPLADFGLASGQLKTIKIADSDNDGELTFYIDSIKLVASAAVITGPFYPKINISPFPVTAAGNVTINIDFNAEVNLSTAPYTIQLITEKGQLYNFTAPSWADNQSWSGSLPVTAEADGIVTLEIKNITFTDGSKLNYYKYSFVIDTQKIFPYEKKFFPNPFSPNGDGKLDCAQISFSLPAPEKVSLWIYDLTGRLIRTLVEDEEMTKVNVSWDGKNDSGEAASIGVYIYILKIGSEKTRGTVVLVK